MVSKMVKNLLILGAGQYGSVVKEVAEGMEIFDQIAFLDDGYGKEGICFLEKVIGKIADLEKYRDEYNYAIPAIGNAKFRRQLIEKIMENGFELPILVAKQAYVAPSAHLAEGVVVEPLAGVHSNAVVDLGSYISMGAVVNHNAHVYECCHIDNNAVVKAATVVEAMTKINACEVVYKLDK